MSMLDLLTTPSPPYEVNGHEFINLGEAVRYKLTLGSSLMPSALRSPLRGRVADAPIFTEHMIREAEEANANHARQTAPIVDSIRRRVNTERYSVAAASNFISSYDNSIQVMHRWASRMLSRARLPVFPAEVRHLLMRSISLQSMDSVRDRYVDMRVHSYHVLDAPVTASSPAPSQQDVVETSRFAEVVYNVVVRTTNISAPSMEWIACVLAILSRKFVAQASHYNVDTSAFVMQFAEWLTTLTYDSSLVAVALGAFDQPANIVDTASVQAYKLYVSCATISTRMAWQYAGFEAAYNVNIAEEDLTAIFYTVYPIRELV